MVLLSTALVYAMQASYPLVEVMLRIATSFPFRALNNRFNLLRAARLYHGPGGAAVIS